MIFLYIFGFYIVCGILVSGVFMGLEDDPDMEDGFWSFFLWPFVLIALCVMGVTKVTKAMINEQKRK